MVRSVESNSDWDLDALAGASGLIDWMASQLGEVRDLDVIEVGAGIGTFTNRLLSGGARSVLAVEPDRPSFARLEARFAGLDQVTLAEEETPGSPALRARSASADLVVAQNVLEHIEDDRAALQEMISTHRPGGRLFILVPAGPWLFGSLDRRFGHFRRYRRAELEDAAQGASLEDISVRFFNLLGVPGWWFRSLVGANTIGHRSLAIYEFLLKLWRPLETKVIPPFGLSLILEAKRSRDAGLQ